MNDISSISFGASFALDSVHTGSSKSIEDQLKELDIDIRNANGELKSAHQILKEISDKYFKS